MTAEDFQNTEYYRDYLKFLKVSGAEASQKLMVQQMFDQIKKAAPGKISADRIEQQMVDELSLLNEQLFPVYKKHLTHQDLKAIIAFYETPIGKKLVQSQPAILKDSFSIGAAWGQGVAQRVMGNWYVIQASACGRRHCPWVSLMVLKLSDKMESPL